MRKLKLSLLILGSLSIFSSSVSFAHEFHCHKKEGNTVVDLKDAKDKKACKAQGGEWKHHHAHCHVKGNPHSDLKKAADEKACVAQGGEWSDHGHDAK